MILRTFAAVAVITAPLHAQCPAGTPDYDVVPLNGLTPGNFNAVALNDAGEVAGIIFDPRQAYVWRNDVLVTRELLSVDVLGINDDGVVVGRMAAEEGAGETVFVWNSRTDRLQTVPTPIEVFPSDINTDLLVVGVDLAGLQGFALDTTNGDFQSIVFGKIPKRGVGTLGAGAVNEGGLVVGDEVVFLPKQGFFQRTPYTWTESGGIEELPGVEGGFGGRAVDVNDAGDIAGWVLDEFSGMQTALWTDGGLTVTNLGSPQNFFVSEALAINASNQIAVVAPNDFVGFTRGFIWDDGEFIDLSCFAPPGLFVSRPVDVNDAGDVLAQLTDAQGLLIVDIVILRPVRIPGDLDGDGLVNVVDLLALLAAWGPCGTLCFEDLDGDGQVGTTDLLIQLANWTG